jgi:hypothetical protein
MRPKARSVSAPAKNQAAISVSRNGRPTYLSMDIDFSERTKCEIYSFDAEVYLKGQTEPIYKEAKTIKLAEIKCSNCLPAVGIDSCGGDPCRSERIYPVTSVLNFDVMPYFKSKTDLVVKFKNFKGIRRLNDLPQHVRELEELSANQMNSDLSNCENEIKGAEKALGFDDLHILITN